jgi:hypothetical protein
VPTFSVYRRERGEIPDHLLGLLVRERTPQPTRSGVELAQDLHRDHPVARDQVFLHEPTGDLVLFGILLIDGVAQDVGVEERGHPCA